GEPERGHARAGFHEEAVGVTVIAAVKLHDHVAAGGGAREPYRRHRRFGAAVHEPQHLERRHPAPDFLGQLYLGLAGRAVGPAAARGVAHRLEHGRMRMTEDQRPPGADVVDIALAVDVVELRALGAGYEKRRSADCPERPYR